MGVLWETTRVPGSLPGDELSLSLSLSFFVKTKACKFQVPAVTTSSLPDSPGPGSFLSQVVGPNIKGNREDLMLNASDERELRGWVAAF